MNNKLYEAYVNRSIRVKLPTSVNGYFLLEEDTKLMIDPETSQAIYGKYKITLNKEYYTLVC